MRGQPAARHRLQLNTHRRVRSLGIEHNEVFSSHRWLSFYPAALTWPPLAVSWEAVTVFLNGPGSHKTSSSAVSSEDKTAVTAGFPGSERRWVGSCVGSRAGRSSLPWPAFLRSRVGSDRTAVWADLCPLSPQNEVPVDAARVRVCSFWPVQPWSVGVTSEGRPPSHPSKGQCPPPPLHVTASSVSSYQLFYGGVARHQPDKTDTEM